MAKCGYCGSLNIVIHDEGVTCEDCSRISPDVFFIDTPCDREEKLYYRDHRFYEMLDEISLRIGISQTLRNRIFSCFKEARKLLKTTSCVDLMLVSIYQVYLRSRSFVSFPKLKYFYPSTSSPSILNNIHFKLVCKNVFEKNPEFTCCEIVNSVIEYFRISMSDSILIRSHINIFSGYMMYSPHTQVIGMTFQYLISGSEISNTPHAEEIFMFLGVRKSTILLKLRLLRKIIIL